MRQFDYHSYFHYPFRLQLEGFTTMLFLSIFLLSSSVPAHATNYDTLQNEMMRIAQGNEKNVRLFDIGKNDAGINIQGLAIGNGQIHNLIVATHHGDETSSTELAMAAAKELAAHPFPDQTVFVIPVLNVGGYNSGRRNETASGVSIDPNRTYPGPCGSAEKVFSLRSTANLDRFVDQEKVVASISLHGPFSIVGYAWGFAAASRSWWEFVEG
jgi:carboxypeptidase T